MLLYVDLRFYILTLQRGTKGTDAKDRTCVLQATLSQDQLMQFDLPRELVRVLFNDSLRIFVCQNDLMVDVLGLLFAFVAA